MLAIQGDSEDVIYYVFQAGTTASAKRMPARIDGSAADDQRTGGKVVPVIVLSTMMSRQFAGDIVVE